MFPAGLEDSSDVAGCGFPAGSRSFGQLTSAFSDILHGCSSVTDDIIKTHFLESGCNLEDCHVFTWRADEGSAVRACPSQMFLHELDLVVVR